MGVRVEGALVACLPVMPWGAPSRGQERKAQKKKSKATGRAPAGARGTDVDLGAEEQAGLAALSDTSRSCSATPAPSEPSPLLRAAIEQSTASPQVGAASEGRSAGTTSLYLVQMCVCVRSCKASAAAEPPVCHAQVRGVATTSGILLQGRSRAHRRLRSVVACALRCLLGEARPADQTEGLPECRTKDRQPGLGSEGKVVPPAHVAMRKPLPGVPSSRRQARSSESRRPRKKHGGGTDFRPKPSLARRLWHDMLSDPQRAAPRQTHDPANMRAPKRERERGGVCVLPPNRSQEMGAQGSDLDDGRCAMARHVLQTHRTMRRRRSSRARRGTPHSIG